MEKNNFQTIVLAICAAGVLIAVVAFSQFSGNSSTTVDALGGPGGAVSIWGTVPSSPAFDHVFQDISSQYQGKITFSYQWHDPATFDRDVIEALASGRGPDILLLPQDLLVRYADKVAPIPYTQISARTFKDTFVDGTGIFLRYDGVVGVPFAVDPVVLFWNRSLFATAGIARPPKDWTEFLAVVPKLTKTDRNGNLTQSGVAFGEFRNITNAKEVIATLLLQSGNQIVSPAEATIPQIALGSSAASQAGQATLSAFRFYLDFADAAKPTFSWSRAQGNSEDAFLSGTLAMHFGFASDVARLRAKNPHLDFDVAMTPQVRDTTAEAVYGRFYALVPLKAGQNPGGAQTAVRLIVPADGQGKLATTLGLTPVRRDTITTGTTDADQAVFFASAIRAKGWLDPDPAQSTVAFQDAVESVTSGRADPSEALAGLSRRLGALLASANFPKIESADGTTGANPLSPLAPAAQ